MHYHKDTKRYKTKTKKTLFKVYEQQRAEEMESLCEEFFISLNTNSVKDEVSAVEISAFSEDAVVESLEENPYASPPIFDEDGSSCEFLLPTEVDELLDMGSYSSPPIFDEDGEAVELLPFLCAPHNEQVFHKEVTNAQVLSLPGCVVPSENSVGLHATVVNEDSLLLREHEHTLDTEKLPACKKLYSWNMSVLIAWLILFGFAFFSIYPGILRDEICLGMMFYIAWAEIAYPLLFGRSWQFEKRLHWN